MASLPRQRAARLQRGAGGPRPARQARKQERGTTARGGTQQRSRNDARGSAGTAEGRPAAAVESQRGLDSGAASSSEREHPAQRKAGHIKVMSDSDLPKLVSFFRQASPYIGQHFGKTFVLMVPGYIIQDEEEDGVLDRLLQDVALLQNLGVKMCLVVGATASINKVLRQMGEETDFVDGYRVTTAAALQAVRQAAGATRIDIESKLSKFFPVGTTRRHGYNESGGNRGLSQPVTSGAMGLGVNGAQGVAEAARGGDFGAPGGFGAARGSSPQAIFSQQRPPVQVVGGNYVMAKHRGVVNGVNFEFTGEVRHVWADAILQHMAQNQVVILNNLGYTESGQVLNCSSYEVARKVSQALKADKLIVYHGEKVAALNLPAWIGLSDDNYVWLSGSHGGKEAEEAVGVGEEVEARIDRASNPVNTSKRLEEITDSAGDSSVAELALAVRVCREGVPRTHLINAYTDGALFLELYTRDGLGTMVSRDLYEGMRAATVADLGPLSELLRPLEEAGTLIRRSLAELEEDITSFTVVQREGRLIGCCLLKKISEEVGEISAFVVHEEFRTEHRGDALLDYVEQRARNAGMKRLVLLTTRTGDWFTARGFTREGTAHLAQGVLPEERLTAIDPQRKSILFTKILDTGFCGPPGSRIGY